MKKIVALLLVFVMVFALCACGEAKTEEPKTEEAPVEQTPGVMSHEEFLAAEEGTQVTVETYVQANESWWDNKITLHAQSPDGGYYLYEVACSEEDAAKLVPGTKIRVTGDKAVWNGLLEIQDCSFEFVDGDSWVAEPLNINELLGTDALEEHMNERFTISGGTVADKGDGAAFFFNWDNSGEDGNCDLYFDVEINGAPYTFVARRYLTAPGSDVYEAVKALQVGDTVDIEGFLYWYEGPQPHITGIGVHAAGEPTEAEVPETEIRVAMITDYGDITDQSFNQTTYEACKEYSEANGLTFKYYKPGSDSDDDRITMIENAIEDGFNVIVMPGYAFAPAIAGTAPYYEDVKFVALDVSEYDLTSAGLETLPDNLYSAVYQEELCGFMAGYAAVKLGYKNLGFLGGMAVPAVIRYGYGFVQGADAAAAELGLTDVTVNYAYGNQFYGDADITAAMDTWYAGGTEVVFACGGGIFTSAAEAAAKVNGKVIGVDVDQAPAIDGSYGEGMTVTSAMKGLASTVKTLLAAIQTGKFEGGKVENLGLVSENPEENYVQIPMATTQFSDSFTAEDYVALVAKMISGEVTVSNDIGAAAADFATVITVNDLGNLK